MITMKKIFLVCCLIALSGVATRGFAADGSNGCGPGWYILKENTLLSSVGRSITNWILFPISTLGMTFGTSNCAAHKLVDSSKKSLHFATKSLDILRHDLVKGQGVHGSNFIATFGCYETVRPQVMSRVREELRLNPLTLESPDLPVLLVLMTQKVIDRDPILAMQCA